MDYRDPMEIYAVTYGYMISKYGKIQMSKVNKVVDELGYDKVNSKTMKDIAEKIDEDQHLSDILDEAIKGKVKPEDLKKYNSDVKPFDDENDVYDVITPSIAKHERILQNNREFRKIQREGSYTKNLMTDLTEELKNHLLDNPFEDGEPFDFEYDPKDSTLVVLLGDWHIGATIVNHTFHGGYDFGVLTRRLKYFIEEVGKAVKQYKPEQVAVIYLGDLIEGADMRGGQKWGLEFHLSEQVAKGVQLLTHTLEEISKFAPTVFLGIRGNHDRMTGQVNKKDGIYNDSAMYIAVEMLLLMQQVGALQNVTIIDNTQDMYNLQQPIRGKVIHANHGDMLKGKGNHIPKFVDDVSIDILVTAHVHNFNVGQKDREQLHIVNGSMMGYNNYSEELNLTKTAPEQTMLVMRDDESPIVLPVFMEHIK